jgi:hypothetical protein
MFKRRWWRRILIGLILLSIIGIAGYFIDRELTFAANEKLLAKVIAETDALDPGWRWEEIEAKREQVPDGENAALAIKKCCDLLGPNWSQIGRSSQDQIPPIDTREDMDSDILESIRSVLKKYSEAIQESLQLPKYTRSRYPILLTPDLWSSRLGHIQDTRQVAHLHGLRVRLSAYDKQPKEVLESLKTILSVAYSLRDEPFLITMLIRCAEETEFIQSLECALSLGELGIELEELIPLLDRVTNDKRLYSSLRYERAGTHHVMKNLEKGVIHLTHVTHFVPNEVRERSLQERIHEFDYRKYLPADHASHLESFNRIIEEMKNGDTKYRDDLANYQQLPQKKDNLLRPLFFTGIPKAYQTDVQTKTGLRCAKVAILVERYRQTHGHWPKSLEDLDKKQLPEIPIDPFDGQPLRYRILEDGVVIY